MNHTTRQTAARSLRVAIVGAAIASAIIAPTALATQVGIRIEGPTVNVLPTTAVDVPGAALKAFTYAPKKSVKAPGDSVFAVLIQATAAAKVPVKWTYYPSFKAVYVSSIGKIGPKGTKGWNFRLNGVASMSGANALRMPAGAVALWYWGTGKESALRITNPADGTEAWSASPIGIPAAGQPLVIKVSSVSTKGTATPAVGASITYGTATATTGADGTATVTTGAPGTPIGATKAGAIRGWSMTCPVAGVNPCPAQ